MSTENWTTLECKDAIIKVRTKIKAHILKIAPDFLFVFVFSFCF